MTAQEKAHQLIKKYRPIVTYKYQAKFCALIGINEAIKATAAAPTIEFLKLVKNELEKL